MSERIQRPGRASSVRQPTVQRPARAPGPAPRPGGGDAADEQPALRLLSGPAGAMRAMWQEQTRVILMMLTPHEQRVLQLRYGVGEPTAAAGDTSWCDAAVAPSDLHEIELAALRKLRHPCLPRDPRRTTRE